MQPLPALNALVMLAILSAAVAMPARASDYCVETIARGLEHPWSLAFLPDGRLLVTERAGRLRVISEQGLEAAPITGLPEVYVKSQAGLFEVLPDVDFANNNRLYLSFAAGSDAANSLRVVAAQLQDMQLVAVEEIFRALPLRPTPVHYGGRMLQLPDQSLLIGYGDGFDYREDAQRRQNHNGSVLRIHTDGSIPADNPFVNEPDMRGEIFSYGHRNVQGLAYDAESRRVWQHEHGPRGGDELNNLEPGRNYGWPLVAHARDYSGARVTPFTESPGVRNPAYIWSRAIAPAGLAIYRGEPFADWDGNLLVAGLASRALHRLELDGSRVIGETRLLEALDRRLRDVRVAPDGSIYLLTDHRDGEVLRLAGC